jgi:hypothetical protein
MNEREFFASMLRASERKREKKLKRDCKRKIASDVARVTGAGQTIGKLHNRD